MQLFNFACHIFFNQNIADPSGSVKGRILNGIGKILCNRDLPTCKILSSQFSYHKQAHLLSGAVQKLLCQLQDIMIISPRQSLISGNHQQSYPGSLFGSIFEIRMLHFRKMAHDTLNGRLQHIKIWFRLFQILFCLFQFGR